MCRTRLLLVTAVLLVLPTLAAAQVTLIDQIPQTAEFGASGPSDSGCGDPVVVILRADDFTVGEPVTIDTIVFWGVYLQETAPNDPEAFVIRIHQDDGGLPGAVLAERTPTISQTLLLVDDDPERSLYEFTATFAPILLGPGVYWAEIVETDATTEACFEWPESFRDEAHSTNGSAFFDPVAMVWGQTADGPDQGLAMRIAGEPATGVPVLDRFALWLLALLLVSAAARRLRRSVAHT